MNYSLKESLLDFIFPPFCINCSREGIYLCEDCNSLVEIFEELYCPFCPQPYIVLDGKACRKCRKTKKLQGLFCATSYQNSIVKTLIHQLKYEPYLARCLAKPLASFIITHFKLVYKRPDLSQYTLVPVPLHKQKLKWRGFNQAAEIAKEVASHFSLELADETLKKIKNTPHQVELAGKKREENVKNSFICPKPGFVNNRKILLIDDVFTTGATMEECARVLKSAGAKEVWGVAVARD